MSADEPPTPPDPAGTQPKVDRDKLLPARIAAPAPPPVDDEPHRPRLPEPFGPVAVDDPLDLPEAPHAARFQFILGALLALGAIAIAGLIWSVGQSGPPDGPSWSPWKPSERGTAAAQQIASHVGPQYKGASGKQLVLISASDLRVGGITLDLVERQAASEGGKISPLDGDAVLFRFCGLGKDCAIPGTPSEARLLLLRREAVEVAGYAFRYLPKLEHTVFFLPPVRTKLKGASGDPERTVTLTNQMLLFRRGDMEPILDVPLRATLKAPPPTVKAVKKAPETPLVQALTTEGGFWYSLSQSATDNHAFLVLDREPQPATIQAAADAAAAEAAQAAATTPATRSPAGAASGSGR